ncbi:MULTISPECIES: S1-like domain-containing RNA-binding protein [unclassified Leeuwenhoekiella]|uniref:CvfB family protein n=1 Tax=unclassified Leeuwenhoekiella TaxID=2615029 RepID=UPI000C4365B7|nr:MULTISPECIES: S1-like domain-containing RNA-binding protein [unclassified Leeuwenhoekiella]MAW95067.1 GntR family transcriptional regulator [Leeuwenhoekiella sp.]MBA79787.1 GntR family transcriptional regulator [Leeuwenhoekiella sp.]|tara:strand:+ start:1525 stop:2361 length:837 start_codon:yes stop_codon:yes gene_type:complete
MLALGEYHDLIIDRDVSPGLYLRDEEENEVLLPGKYAPDGFQLEDQIRVFVYLDNEERPVATTLSPYIHKQGFAYLECTAVTKIGAFVDWGLDKELFVPFSNQATEMKEGQWYIIYLYLDEQTNRLVGSSKFKNFLSNAEVTVEKFDRVDLLISHFSEFGAHVIINEKHEGLIHKSTIFEDIRIGDRLPGYIKRVREDNKIDVLLQPEGYKSVEPNAQFIYEELKRNGGSLPVHDKSSPEDINAYFGISKKLFKKAIGSLYKDRQIDITDTGIRLKNQ